VFRLLKKGLSNSTDLGRAKVIDAYDTISNLVRRTHTNYVREKIGGMSLILATSRDSADTGRLNHQAPPA